MGGTLIAVDSFKRANQSGWGTASDGESWSTVLDTPTLSISGNEGVSAGAHNAMMKLGSRVLTDAEALARFNFTSGGVGKLLLRLTADTANYYLCTIQPNFIQFQQQVNFSFSNQNSASPTLNAGSFYWLRFRVQGNNLFAKVWADGTVEPQGWTLTQSNVTGPTGGAGFGIGYFGSAAGDSIQVDSFSVGTIFSQIGAAAFRGRSRQRGRR